MTLKNNFRKLYVKIFSRKINGLLIGGKVKIENKGTIKSGNNSYLGAIDNHTVKMVWNGKESFLDNSGTFIIGNNTRIHKGFGITNTGHFSIGEGAIVVVNE